MEDITGLIIYIILAIIGVLAGVYRNKYKKKTAIPPPLESATVEAEQAETPESTFDPFTGLFEEKVEDEDLVAEMEIKEEELIAEENINKEETTAEREIEKKDSYKQEYSEGEAVFNKTNEVLISDGDSGITSDEISDTELIDSISDTERDEYIISDHEEYSEREEKFDLRKAVIYSEILKRREY